MRVSILLFICLLSGCAAQSPARRPNFSISDGTWVGSMDWGSVRADKSTNSGTMKLALVACSGEVRFYVGGVDGKFTTPYQNFVIHSNAQTHVIHFVDAAEKQPDWVEIQTLTLIETDNESATGQWTRAVNNRNLPATAGERVFFRHGIGNFKRVATQCDKSMVHPF